MSHTDIYNYITAETQNWGDMDQVAADFEDYNAIRVWHCMCLQSEIERLMGILERNLGG